MNTDFFRPPGHIPLSHIVFVLYNAVNMDIPLFPVEHNNDYYMFRPSESWIKKIAVWLAISVQNSIRSYWA